MAFRTILTIFLIVESMPPKSATNPNFSITLILLGAIGAAFFTVGAGALVYWGTSRLISKENWVQHTLEDLTSLQDANQSLDHVELNAKLYRSTSSEEDLNTARTAIVRLQSNVLHLKDQVSDNPLQSSRAAELESCSNSLSRNLDSFSSTRFIAQDQLFRCRQALNLMVEEERKLLRERTKASLSNSSLALTSDLAFGALSLLLLSSLSTFLLRDGFARRRIAAQNIQMNQALAQSVQALEEQASESKLLTNARDELQLCVTLEEVYACAVRSVSQFIPDAFGAIGIINNSRHLVETVGYWGTFADAPSLPEIYTPGSCCGLRSGDLRWRRPGVSEVHCTHFQNGLPESYACVPMMAGGETIGVLFLEVRSENVVCRIEARMEGLRQLIQLIGMSVASLQLRVKLEHQSIRDPLTHLFNRHFMQITLEKEFARAKRKRTTLCVLMIDVDHFKSFNDRFGHAAGDSVLESVAAVLTANVRTEDYVCRFGGEEFVIILPETDAPTALKRAEKVREVISRLPASFDQIPRDPVTISIGLTSLSLEITQPADLIRRADEALYRAKNEGRNRIFCHEDTLLSTESINPGVLAAT